MEIFIDSSSQKEIKTWLEHGVVDGVTTNPSILLKDGCRDLKAGAIEICQMAAPLPVSIEVTSNNLDEMLRQARQFTGWAENVVVKIPIINEHGDPALRVIKALSTEGIKINVTACLSYGQAMLAAKAGATYVSLFIGRINDEGNDGPGVVRMTRRWLDLWQSPAKIIAGSIRSVMDIQQAADAGAHVLTIPPQFLTKMVDHQYTRLTVQQFVRDGQKAFEESRGGY